MSTFNNNHGKSQDAIRQDQNAAHGKPAKKSQVKSTLNQQKPNRPFDRTK